MKEKSDDRRVRYSKMVLKQCLIELLQQKNIDKITVTELCERADINRSTFYAHYTDPFDLLHQVEREVVDELDKYLQQFSFIGGPTESFRFINKIFDYIAANADLCRVVLSENGSITFQKELMTYVQQISIREWQGVEKVDAELVDYLSLFGVNGCIGVIQKWLQSGLKKTPAEMAELIITLTYEGLAAFMK
jgi:AcrR family transcriptional regulator